MELILKIPLKSEQQVAELIAQALTTLVLLVPFSLACTGVCSSSFAPPDKDAGQAFHSGRLPRIHNCD